VLEDFSIFSNSVVLKNKLDTQMAHQIGKTKQGVDLFRV
jgi:hypothetical protein